MTKIKDFIILSSICLTLYSCKGEQSSIEYNADALETAETCNATLEKIDTEVELGSPSRIEFISDSLISWTPKDITSPASAERDVAKGKL